MFKHMVGIGFIDIGGVVADGKGQLRIAVFYPKQLCTAFFMGKADKLCLEHLAV